MNRNAVGIDVSKPFEVRHTSSAIRFLIDRIKSIDGESRIVMEHTGCYYEPLAHKLSQATLFVSAINPKLIIHAFVVSRKGIGIDFLDEMMYYKDLII